MFDSNSWFVCISWPELMGFFETFSRLWYFISTMWLEALDWLCLTPLSLLLYPAKITGGFPLAGLFLRDRSSFIVIGIIVADLSALLSHIVFFTSLKLSLGCYLLNELFIPFLAYTTFADISLFFRFYFMLNYTVYFSSWAIIWRVLGSYRIEFLVKSWIVAWTFENVSDYLFLFEPVGMPGGSKCLPLTGL